MFEQHKSICCEVNPADIIPADCTVCRRHPQHSRGRIRTTTSR